VALGLKCDACHGEGKKQPVKSEKCLGCHQSFEEVAKRTQDIVPNPHSNHITESGDLECTQCHQGHKADIIYCANCHSNISFKRHSATPAGK
jgi:fumarate reductase flavoprotein subunit